ncbi:MAG: response regulator, partial [Oceanipulchritudo sp.]
MLGAAPFGDPFRLVILDWHMPGKKGTEAVKIISELERIPLKPRFMIMSGFWNEELHRDLEESGVSDFLPKPFKTSTLLDLIVRKFSDEVMEVVNLVQDTVTEGIPELSHAHLLLAEDNELNQEVALGLLEETGCRVSVVENGKAALETIKKEAFDLVLMDIQMPELDGYETTRKIREMEAQGNLLAKGSGNPKAGRIPIIAMTAGTLSRDRHRAFEAGMDDHVPKPVDPDLLYRVLAKWIGREAAAGLPALKPKESSPEREPSPESEPQPDQEAGPLRSLAPFPGIDLPKALSHLRGNEERLEKLMVKFVKNQATVVEDIRTALDAGEREDARRLAHTLKGLAGLIGATGLQDSARKLETALKGKTGESDENALLEATEHSLQEVMDGLSRLKAGKPAVEEGPAKPTISGDKALKLLDKLLSLLKDGDSEALPCFDQLEATGAFPGSGEESARLRNLIEAYSFGEAGELLEQLIYGPNADKETVNDD